MDDVISQSTPSWMVTIATYFRFDNQEYCRRTYGPFKRKWLARFIGWLNCWDNEYCTVSKYWLDEV